MTDIRISLAVEIVSELSDEQFMAFVNTEQKRRNSTVKSLEFGQRVRFSAATRPKRLAMATGTIKDMKYVDGAWKYSVKMDGPAYGTAETFIRILRSQLEVIALDAPVKYAGAKKSSPYTKW